MRTRKRAAAATTRKCPAVHHVEQEVRINGDTMGSPHSSQSSHSAHTAHTAHTTHTTHMGERGTPLAAAEYVGWIKKVIAVVISLTFSVCRFSAFTIARGK